MIRRRLLMNKYPIHQNLNTSFVNLTALVRHLRRLQFVGSVRIELSSYEAEIEFKEDGSVATYEKEHNVERVSFGGDETLSHVLIRSMEPDGSITVYKNAGAANLPVFVDEAITNGACQMIADEIGRQTLPVVPAHSADAPYIAVDEAPAPGPQRSYELMSLENWTELLGLISELMRTVDIAMAKGNLNFADVFRNACGFVSYDHPFLDPDTDVFSYSDGYISIRQRMASQEVIEGVIEALGRIMQRLREDPHYGTLYHQTKHLMRVLANRRKLQFDSFGLGTRLHRITGI